MEQVERAAFVDDVDNQRLRELVGTSAAQRLLIFCIAHGWDTSLDKLRVRRRKELRSAGLLEAEIQALKKGRSKEKKKKGKGTIGMKVSDNGAVLARGDITVNMARGEGRSKGMVVKGKGLVEAESIEINMDEVRRREMHEREEVLCVQGEKAIYLEQRTMKDLWGAMEATVRITGTDEESVGTGFMLADDLVATAAHVLLPGYRKRLGENWRKEGEEEAKHLHVEGMGHVQLEAEGERLVAESAVVYESRDVALIRVHVPKEGGSGRKTIARARSALPKTGAKELASRCFVVGHSKEGKKVISMQRENFVRCVSSEGRFVEYFTDTEPGFSGGPVLVVEEGEVRVLAVHHTGTKMASKENSKIMVGVNSGTLLSCVPGI